MPTWSLLHRPSPLNAGDTTRWYGELTKASGRKLTFSTVEPATLTFDMPGNHPQTAALEPLLTDVLAFRDAEVTQRFRIVSRSLSKDGGVLKASFSAVSYKALLDAWVVHSGDTKHFLNAEQTAIAWTVISEGQARANGALGLTRGILPATTVNRNRIGGGENLGGGTMTAADDTVTFSAAHGLDEDDEVLFTTVTAGGVTALKRYFVKTAPTATTVTLKARRKESAATLDITSGGSFTHARKVSDGTQLYAYDVGTRRGDIVRQLAEVENGFEWDIEPSRSDPYGALEFNAWNVGTRSTQTGGARSPLLLDDGGSMMSWSHTVTPTDYANVVRFTGSDATKENALAAKMLPKWVPATENPAVHTDRGRWERDISDSDLTSQAAVDERAQRVFDEANLYVPEITCNLRRGRWKGLSQLWLGDTARLIITEPVVGGSGYIIYVDEDVRVVEVSVDVDDQGAEDVSLSLNRARFSSKRNTREVYDRLKSLERR